MATTKPSSTFLGISGAFEKIFIATNSGNQSVPTGTATTVTFDTVDLNQGSHFASNKFTAPSDGKYMFFANWPYIESSGSVDQRMYIEHYNSSDASQGSKGFVKTFTHEASVSGGRAMNLSATDYVVLRCYHLGGSNKNLYNAQFFGWKVS